jgi:hypothetical protein
MRPGSGLGGDRHLVTPIVGISAHGFVSDSGPFFLIERKALGEAALL